MAEPQEIHEVDQGIKNLIEQIVHLNYALVKKRLETEAEEQDLLTLLLENELHIRYIESEIDKLQNNVNGIISRETTTTTTTEKERNSSEVKEQASDCDLCIDGQNNDSAMGNKYDDKTDEN